MSENDPIETASPLPAAEAASSTNEDLGPKAAEAVAAEKKLPPPASFSAPTELFAQLPAEPLPGPSAPTAPAEEPLLFQSFTAPRIQTPERIPHLGHLGILAVLVLFGLLATSLLTRLALSLHLLGISTVDAAAADIHYTLASQTIFYLFTGLASLLLFPLLWQKSFSAGLQWNGAVAFRLRYQLFGAAFLCFLLALVNGMAMPGPPDTPIDKIIRAPGAPWLLFAFGVSFAPFFEELAFRGFLLPALATAADWIGERFSGSLPPPLDANGHPQWSISAMIVASVATSIPFARMHAPQTGYAIGPFLLLLAVSLVLCGVRLLTRSLAASVLVHACYNFLLFSLMLLGTGGFRHLENM